ncbi:hypothetical protein WMY93_027178 [Mugilogobius chulae]|uniref:X-box-binding protein 1 n=1 Tax=Mugilogobius chulae TaxID=88201 RepID=A0AAW0MWA8_9GOBI
MITRRRGRALTVSEGEEPVEVEVCDSDASPTQPANFEDFDSASIELDELFSDFKWTLDRDSTSPLFDNELEELGIYGNTQDSPEVSPNARRNELKVRKTNQSHGLNKNAIAARLNRIKKKEYVSSLERKVSGLSTENTTLKRENSELSKRVEELEDETRYLRAVLANESTLAQLLARLSGVNGMKLSSSLFQGGGGGDHDYALPRKRARVDEKEGGAAGGVCLHVDRDHVSVEFCPKCSERASAALKLFF